MGCGTSKDVLSSAEINRIKEASGVKEKEIKFWRTVWLQVAPSGKMSEEEFVNFIVSRKFGKEQDARTMFRMMDRDGNGKMEFQEFVLVLVLPKKTENMTPEHFAKLCIAIYDEDGNGVITKEELLNFALAKAKAEGRLTPEKREQIGMFVNQLVEYIDTNADGNLSTEEIVEAIRKSPQLKELL